jgi:hypothetical protein
VAGQSTESSCADNIQTSLAATVAPEDLRCGDFVAILSEIDEWPSFFWCCDSGMWPRDEPVRLRRLGAGDASPLKIQSICLPFVFVKTSANTYRTLDVRLCQLARLSPVYAKKVLKKLRKKTPSNQART